MQAWLYGLTVYSHLLLHSTLLQRDEALQQMEVELELIVAIQTHQLCGQNTVVSIRTFRQMFNGKGSGEADFCPFLSLTPNLNNTFLKCSLLAKQ